MAPLGTFLLLIATPSCLGFTTAAAAATRTTKTTQLSAGKQQQLPTTTAETISQMTAATQAALQSRCSRMDVELPPGASLGVEAGGLKKTSAGLFGLSMPSIPGMPGGGGGGGGLMGGAGGAGQVTEEGLKALQRGDRELARLYTEMFRPIGEAVTVAFGTEGEAAAARKVWGASARVVSLTAESPAGGGGNFKDFDAAAAAAKSQGDAWKGLGKKKGTGKAKVGSRKGGKGKGGFAAKMKAATAPSAASKTAAAATSGGGGGSGGSLLGGVVPSDTEVLVVVAPKGEAELKAVEGISREAGMGCCVVLLNARLEAARYASTEQRDYFLETFEPVFQLKPPPPGAIAEAKERNGGADVATPIVSRAYPEDWQLSCTGVGVGGGGGLPGIGGGKPQPVKSFKERPSVEELAAALAEVEVGDAAGGVFDVNSLLGGIKNMVG